MSFWKKKRTVYDSETTIMELLTHCAANFLHGLTSAAVMTAITLANPVLIPIAYLIHKKIDSIILNRKKYTSKLGKDWIYPWPSTVGFFLGYLLTVKLL